MCVPLIMVPPIRTWVAGRRPENRLAMFGRSRERDHTDHSTLPDPRLTAKPPSSPPGCWDRAAALDRGDGQRFGGGSSDRGCDARPGVGVCGMAWICGEAWRSEGA